MVAVEGTTIERVRAGAFSARVPASTGGVTSSLWSLCKIRADSDSWRMLVVWVV